MDEGHEIVVEIIKQGMLDQLKLLVQSGASLKTLDSDLNNLLHIAAEVGHLDILGYLIEKGVNTQHKNKQ